MCGCGSCTADIRGEGYTLDIDELEMAASEDLESNTASFIGHMQNLYVDNVDVIGLVERHNSTQSVHHSDVSVLINTADITQHELPIPIHPLTLPASPVNMAYVRLETLDLSHGNATLKMMFKTLV